MCVEKGREGESGCLRKRGKRRCVHDTGRYWEKENVCV